MGDHARDEVRESLTEEDCERGEVHESLTEGYEDNMPDNIYVAFPGELAPDGIDERDRISHHLIDMDQLDKIVRKIFVVRNAQKTEKRE
eukprot:4978388-Ditylum_brightwellii.AAC.1